MNDNNPVSAGRMADAGPAAADGAGPALAAAEAKANENWNSYLRAVAELENYRKRMDRELDNARKYAIERFAQELVSVGGFVGGRYQRRRGKSRLRSARGLNGDLEAVACGLSTRPESR